MSKDNKDILTLEYENIKKLFNIVFATEEGKKVLKHICNMCGYGQSPIVVNNKTTEISPLSTVYNEGMASVYRHIRTLINNDILKDIEY